MRDIKFRAWDKALKRWTNYSIDDDLLMFYDKHAECWETDQGFKILGNIYENPELLKELTNDN